MVVPERARPIDGAAEGAFRKWVLAGGIYNFLIGVPLAIPVADQLYYSSMNSLNELLGLGGGAITLPADGVHHLFINVAGLLLAGFGALLLYAAADLRNRSGIALVNTVTRLLSVFLVLYYSATENIARLMLPLVIPDIVFSVAFIYYLFRSSAVSRRSSVSSGGAT